MLDISFRSGHLGVTNEGYRTLTIITDFTDILPEPFTHSECVGTSYIIEYIKNTLNLHLEKVSTID